MVVAGHYVPFIKNNVFAVGGLLIYALARRNLRGRDNAAETATG